MSSIASRLATSFNIPSRLLRRALLTDAALTGASGIALLLGAGPLGALLELPSEALRITGAIFVPFAAFAGWLGTRSRVNRHLVFALIALNALWAVDSGLLLLAR